MYIYIYTYIYNEYVLNIQHCTWVQANMLEKTSK